VKKCEGVLVAGSVTVDAVIYRKNLNNWTVCYVVGLSSPSKVKKFLFFFLSRREERGRVFAVFLPPFQRREFWTS